MTVVPTHKLLGVLDVHALSFLCWCKSTNFLVGDDTIEIQGNDRFGCNRPFARLYS